MGQPRNTLDTDIGSAGSSAQRDALRAYPRIVAIVSYDEPTEQFQPPALYTLTAKGVVQDRGGQGS